MARAKLSMVRKPVWHRGLPISPHFSYCVGLGPRFSRYSSIVEPHDLEARMADRAVLYELT